MLSPIIVDLRCPTCISFAIFGEEKSTKTLSFFSKGNLISYFRYVLTKSSIKSSYNLIVRNPFSVNPSLFIK